MANVVKQIDILKQISSMLKTEFDCTVYSDEVLENFTKPCFFIKCLCTNIPQSKNVTKKKISIIITYFPKKIDKNEMHYVDVMDRLQMVFEKGIQLKERYIHLNEFLIDRVGEEQDIIQATVRVEFLDRIIRPYQEAEIMEDVQMKVKINCSNRT